jgi:cytochrome c oxidase subunit III
VAEVHGSTGSAIPVAEGRTEAHAIVAHQFDDSIQQYQAANLGMWGFLATEVLFFAGMFLAYTVYHFLFPEAFYEASNHLDIWLGTINTAVLISSSLTVVLAVHAAQENKSRLLFWMLLLTVVLGLVFLGIKFTEYHHKYEEHLVPGLDFRYPGEYGKHAAVFFSLYFAMTGLHAVHMIIGIGVFLVLAWEARHGRYSRAYHTPVELSGLYWHFVDIIWIFLFPLFYLLGRHIT